MVIIQPTPFCNINCSYCYLPDRANKHVLAQETVAKLFAELFASGWSNPELTVLWHAGEPLAVPISFYREAFATIERLRPKHGPGTVVVKHSFQTNGMLINADWCEFFREWQVGIGVSIDGPRELHDAHRKTRSGGGTFDKTIAGIRCLRENDWPFHTLSVLSRASLDMPEEMLAFFISEGIDHVCFNVEESEGDYVSDLFQGAELRQRYERFLRTFWHLARADGRVKFVREIDHALPRVFRPEGVRARNIQVEPLGMINVDSHGNVSSFSPELLGYKNADYGDFLLGNIHQQSLAEIYQGCLDSAFLRDIQAGTAACQAGCEYFSVCGGGAPVNKFFENGKFDSTTTSFCTLTQMVPTDLILEAFDKLEQNWTEQGPPIIAPPASELSSRTP
jgi:uncharacterized protein